MKTIEERAEQYANPDYAMPSYVAYAQRNAYIAGATEQKAIDDAKLLKLKSAWEKQAQINHDDEANYKQGYHDAIDKACGILEDMTEGRLGKRFISEFKNKLKYGVLERHKRI